MLLFAALIVGAAAGFELLYVPAEERHEVETAYERLDARARDRVHRLSLWAEGRIADLGVTSRFPSVVGLLAEPHPAHVPDRVRHIEPILSDVARARRADGLYVLTESGALLLATAGAPPAADAWRDRAARSAGGVWFADDARGNPYVLFAAPVAGERRLGSMLIAEDPRHWLDDTLSFETVPTRTGETYLATREGDRTLRLSPLRRGGDRQGAPTLPASALFDARTARYDGPDDRGRRVLGMVHAVPGTPWRVVATVEADDALAPNAQRLRTLRAALAATLLGLGGLGVAFARDRRARILREANVRLEEAVAARTAALRAANAELETFAYSVSHDLRAPLRAIDGFSRILTEDFGPALGDEGNRQLGVVRENARRMGQLIDDLLAFSRVARHEIAHAPIDMAALARGAFFEVTDPAQRERIDFRLAPLPSARGDAALVRQVLLNLLGNAVKFSATVPSPSIAVDATVEGRQVVYRVSDNGVGFDMQYADKLFTVFQRLHSATEFEGTGVGLAIVRRVVERHGGRTWAESRPGAGATFYFTLEAAGPAPEREAVTAPAAHRPETRT